MSKKYTNVIVLKVDVDECEVSADVLLCLIIYILVNNTLTAALL